MMRSTLRDCTLTATVNSNDSQTLTSDLLADHQQQILIYTRR